MDSKEKMKRKQQDRSETFYSTEASPKYQNNVLDMLFPTQSVGQSLMETTSMHGGMSSTEQCATVQEFHKYESFAKYFKKELNVAQFVKYFLHLLELEDEQARIECCIQLVLGYFNKFLNKKPEIFVDMNNDETDDGIKCWHAERIGKGGFGSVLKVSRRSEETGQIESVRAIKIIPNSTMGLSEAIIGAKINFHPNVVKVYNVMLIRFICCIEMEYIESGSLHDLIKTNADIPCETITNMLLQSCEVMSLMRQNQMVHMDIKPANIMIRNERDFDIVVGDFGLSIQMESLLEPSRGGTRAYLAPELSIDNFNPNFHTDLFALGLTFKNLIQACSKNSRKLYYLNEAISGLTSDDPYERELAFYNFVVHRIFSEKNINSTWENDVVILSRILDVAGNIDRLKERLGFSLKIGRIPSKDKDFITKYKLYAYADGKDENLRRDRAFLLKSLKYGTVKLFENADETLLMDAEFMLDAIEINPEVFLYADKSLQMDQQYMAHLSYKARYQESLLNSFRKHANAFEWANSSLRHSKDFIIKSLQENGKVLEFIDPQFKKDRELVYEAVRENGRSFKFADSSLNRDEEFVLELMKFDGRIMKYVDESLKNDKTFVMKAIKEDGGDISVFADTFKTLNFGNFLGHNKAIKYIGEELRKDREISLATFNQWGSSIECLDPSLKTDRQFLLEAIKTNAYMALQFADESLRKDREIILEAVKNGAGLDFVDESLKGDDEIQLIVGYQMLPFSIKQELGWNDFETYCEAMAQRVGRLDEEDEEDGEDTNSFNTSD